MQINFVSIVIKYKSVIGIILFNISKGSHQKNKCHKLWKKSIIFLTPPLGCFGLFWIWEKIDFRWPPPSTEIGKNLKQAGAELGQAQLKLELGFTSIKICCIELIN